MSEQDELVERTHIAYRQLSDVVGKLSEADLTRKLDDVRTVSATLAHIAFWDSWIDTRWARFEQLGAFDDLPDVIAELINAAGLPTWLVIPPIVARELCLSAAASVDAKLHTLSPDAMARAIATSRPQFLDRARHWNEHLLELGALLN
jgi:hypothetical protein